MICGILALSVHKPMDKFNETVLYVCIFTAALQIDSPVPFFYILLRI